MVYLRVGRLDAVGVLCIGLVGGLADGEELKPCFMTERGISGTMQVTDLRPQGVDRAARLPVAEDHLEVKVGRGAPARMASHAACAATSVGRVGSTGVPEGSGRRPMTRT